MQLPKWVETVERWLGRLHLVAWIIGLIVAAFAGLGTVIAGAARLIPPWWTIPAGLLALTIPIVALNQLAAIRARRQEQAAALIPAQGRTAFPIRSLFAGLLILLVIVLPTGAYILGYPERSAISFEDKRVPDILNRLSALEKRPLAQPGPQGERGIPGPLDQKRDAVVDALAKMVWLQRELDSLNSRSGQYEGLCSSWLESYKQGRPPPMGLSRPLPPGFGVDIVAMAKNDLNKMISLSTHPNFDDNPERSVPGDDLIKDKATQRDYRKLYDQCEIGKSAINNLQGDYRGAIAATISEVILFAQSLAHQ
jgi:hypothetical protein